MDEASLFAARALAYGTLLLSAGLPAYGLTAGRGLAQPGAYWKSLAALALAGAAASVFWAAASIASMAAMPIASLDRPTLLAVLGATPLGKVLIVRLAALALLALIALVASCRTRLRSATLWMAAICGGAALTTCAWTGHAGASEGVVGTMHRLADAIHLLAAATWLGGLVMLLSSLLIDTPVEEQTRRLAGFATTGTAIVALLLATGMVNTLEILGWPLSLAMLDSRWSALLAIKLGLFTFMLGLAGLNRWRLTPALAAMRPGATARLRLSLTIETLAALVIILVVSALGMLNPAG